MNKVKIIFLDIDGVLKRVQDKGINPIFVANIKELIEKTGAKIVISSDWRYNGMDFIKKYLPDIKEHIIDLTPSFDIKKSEDVILDLYVAVPRGFEIREWMNNYISREHYVSNYVIIDDSQDMLYGQRDNYVQVDQTKGFDKKCLEKALSILEKSNVVF